MSNSASSRNFTLQQVQGKGKGLIANQKITKGARILSEKPIITIASDTSNIEQLHESIYKQSSTLDEDQQRAFLSMRNIHPYKDAAEQYFGIFRTNSLPAEADGDKAAIFLDACRINHACNNNAQKSWNEKTKCHTVHALKDIARGEEITITYLSPLKNRKARQKALQEKFGFTCLCHLCSLPAEQSQESDRRLEEIRCLDDVIDQLGADGILVFPLRTLGYFDRQVCLYNEEARADVGFAHALVNAAQLVIANSDLARGRIFAKKAASVWKTALGSDSAEAIRSKLLAQDPSTYELCGVSTRWKTKLDDVPQGLRTSDFEDWLWRREKPRQPGQPADFRRRSTFPGFNDLPHENHLDPAFYMNHNESNYQPRRHWLFLAEIVDVSAPLRLQMTVKDVDGMTVPLFFYTERRGQELSPSHIRSGYTVAILYARFHRFAFSEPRIRLEEQTNLKVASHFPPRRKQGGVC